ncbi:U32 family peptidase, partial [Candidatus Woesearchaeota archaeon]|nr:U32 family peptidase [Candidatus Woesearchaeota archaeon]
MTRKKPELLAPVGNFVSLKVAIDSGCDAIYFGIKNFNMRQGAKNFTIDDLEEISKICKENNVKSYLTLNIIAFDEELERFEEIIKHAKGKVDAIICWDQLIIQLCKKHNVPFHISTQASVSNSSSAQFYKDLGAERIVFARECSLNQINNILENVEIESEVFIHGAMCVAVSGRCFMSQFSYGKSANRGQCLQNCRREYNIKDVDREFEFNLGNNYVMSAKDLCALPFLEKLMNFDSFKIEGRNRSPEYVKTVVEVYREAIDLCYENKLTKEIKKKLMDKLKTVYNRDFSKGFYMGKPINEFTDEYGSKATTKKEYIGKVVNYYSKQGVAEIIVESNVFEKGSKLMVQGNKTGVQELIVDEIMQD